MKLSDNFLSLKATKKSLCAQRFYSALRTTVILITIVFVFYIYYYNEIFSESAYLNLVVPTLGNIVTLLLALLFALFIRDRSIRILYIFWLMWMIFGFLNICASILSERYVFSTKYVIYDSEIANYIHILFVFAFGFGVVTAERLLRDVRHIGGAGFLRSQILPSVPSSLFILSFPFLYLASFLASVGLNIPILSGRNVTAEIYEADYGALYFIQSWILISMAYSFVKYRVSENPRTKFIYLLLLIIFIPISILSGKRRIIISFLLSAAYLLSADNPIKIARAKALAGIVFIYMFIIGLVTVRSGDSLFDIRIIRFIGFIGDEYSDFIKSIGLYSPEHMRDMGYDFWGSLVGSALNRNILLIFGYDKAALVAGDSGTVWSVVFNEQVGIRTGIVSEAWYANEFLGIFILYGLGFLVSYVRHSLLASSSLLATIFLSIILAILSTAINGQMSVLVGQIVSILYFVILIATLNLLFRKKKLRPPI